MQGVASQSDIYGRPARVDLYEIERQDGSLKLSFPDVRGSLLSSVVRYPVAGQYISPTPSSPSTPCSGQILTGMPCRAAGRVVP